MGGARSPYGPRPLGALLPALTRSAFKRRSPAGAMLLADWVNVVGPALAAVTRPQRLAQGTLTLGCTGPVAMELSHLAPQLIQRINGHLGRVAVERLRFVQLPGLAPKAAPPRPEPAPLPPATHAALEALPSGELREALAKLAAGVYRNRR
ncbi:DUF721 domain-containing protein [Siccirubricoccus sp. KC 17139]|uniref:DUF721 domain-containing protein n=1 Tax=Siccirubricoccus soli TaxID=2899147 RepID=A0ABT1D803_9PROT|nr:DUF721 domain-containing protein [Siccirubricoccus soli]MCO6417737.1 DUF721 domain-containing protein [Siccirubricoccus soli]MCP2683872.1 DUF721 domain-containing protein [Siccirubricoccus soli]